MSKYQPLADRLAGQPGAEWRTSFAEVEKVLGFALPKTARTGAAWWANNGERPQVRAWTGAGWEVAEVDPRRELLVFRRPVSEAELQNPRIEEVVLPEVAPQCPYPPRVGKGAQRWAFLAAGAAVTAGLGALLVRGLLKRDRTPNL